MKSLSATETGETLGRTTFRTWPKSPKNPQQPLDPGRESLRECLEMLLSFLGLGGWETLNRRNQEDKTMDL